MAIERPDTNARFGRDRRHRDLLAVTPYRNRGGRKHALAVGGGVPARRASGSVLIAVGLCHLTVIVARANRKASGSLH